MSNTAQTKNSLQELKGSISRWTSEQAVCAEKEDYEEADRLQTLIEDNSKKVRSLHAARGTISRTELR